LHSYTLQIKARIIRLLTANDSFTLSSSDMISRVP